MAASKHPLEDPDCAALFGQRRNGSKVWFRREDATNAAKNALAMTGSQFSVFAKDKPDSERIGSKQYYCMSMCEFTILLDSIPSEEWCFYEVTDPERPCRIYLDAEADLTVDPKFDGSAAHDRIVTEFTAWLAGNVCPRFGDPDKFKWTVLDASSEAKWSRHYIGVGECMKNPFHVGAVVRRFEQYCADKHGLQSQWFTNKKHKLNADFHRSFILDNAVYTEYRVYRMAHQRKWGSTRVMNPIPAWPTTFDDSPEEDHIRNGGVCARLWYDSLVQPPHLITTIDDGHMHEFTEMDGSQPRSMTNASGACARAMVQARRTTDRQERSPGVSSRTRSRIQERGRQRCPIDLYAFAQKAILKVLGRTIRPHNTAGFYPDEMTITVQNEDAWCYIKQAEHHEGDRAQSHSYYCINASTKEITQKCFSSLCSSRLELKSVRAMVRWPLTQDLIKDLDVLLGKPGVPGVRVPGFLYTDDVKAVIARSLALPESSSRAV